LRQQVVFHRLPDSCFFFFNQDLLGFDQSSQHVYSFSLPVFLFSFSRDEPPSSQLRPSQVSHSLLRLITTTGSNLFVGIRLPLSRFWGPRFQSASHKQINHHHHSSPSRVIAFISLRNAPPTGAINGLSYPSIWPFNQYQQIQISPLCLTRISPGA
jgi:hypothetical protein